MGERERNRMTQQQKCLGINKDEKCKMANNSGWDCGHNNSGSDCSVKGSKWDDPYCCYRCDSCNRWGNNPDS